jgi:hypothetical protein
MVYDINYFNFLYLYNVSGMHVVNYRNACLTLLEGKADANYCSQHAFYLVRGFYIRFFQQFIVGLATDQR